MATLRIIYELSLQQTKAASAQLPHSLLLGSRCCWAAGAPMLAANASYHECTKIKGRSKACVLCVLDGVKTERGYKRESAYMCKQCNVTLCRISCFTQYHADRCMD